MDLTVWILKNEWFQILREINLGHNEALKTEILTTFSALNHEFLGIPDISKFGILQKLKVKACEMVKMAVFWPFQILEIDFT